MGPSDNASGDLDLRWSMPLSGSTHKLATVRPQDAFLNPDPTAGRAGGLDRRRSEECRLRWPRKAPTMSRLRCCECLPSFLADPQRHNLYHIAPSAHACRRRAGEPIADEIDKLIGGEAVRAQHMLCAALRVAISEQMKRTATVGLGQATTDWIAGRHGARVIGNAGLRSESCAPGLAVARGRRERQQCASR